MYRFPRKFAAAASAALLSLSLFGCSTVQPTPSTESSETAAAEETASADRSDSKSSGGKSSGSKKQETSTAASADVPTQTDFSNKDTKDTWAMGTPEIKLNGDSVSADSSNVQVDGSTATVNAAGSYLVSGSLTDGQIIVEAGDQDDVQLILDGADITCSDGPAIHIKSADKVILTLASGKDNSVTDGAVYADTSQEAPSAVIYAEEDLSINGTGSLTVTANNNNGIATKDDLVIVDGNLTVTAPNHALKAKDSVSIGSGTFVLDAGGDAIQSDQDSDASKGWVVIDDGTFTITAGNDGIQAETGLTIHGGEFNITTNGGAENAEQKSSQDRFGGGFRFPGGDGEFSFGDGQMPDFGGQRPDGSDFRSDGWTPDGSTSGFGGRKHKQRPGTTDQETTADGTMLPTSIKLSADASADTEPSESAAPSEETSRSSQEAGTQKSRPARPDAETSATEMRPESPAAQARPETSAGTGSSASATTSSDSYKGIKSGGNILIDGGIFDLNCADDGVHSDASITLAGGKFRIASGDDGVHSEADLTIRADIEITESYEGIEGLNIQIEDGTISVKSSDDGVNAAGDGGHPSVNVSGGVLNVQSGGDGIDSNGEINVSGGDVQVLIRSAADNCAMDAETSFTVTGGNLIYGGTGTGSGPQNGSLKRYRKINKQRA